MKYISLLVEVMEVDNLGLTIGKPGYKTKIFSVALDDNIKPLIDGTVEQIADQAYENWKEGNKP